jgi:hypothetical protein
MKAHLPKLNRSFALFAEVVSNYAMRSPTTVSRVLKPHPTRNPYQK